MFGRIDVITGVILLVSTLGALTDLFKGKIYNWLTLPAILLGWIYSGWALGLGGLVGSLGGTFLGLLLYGWMFWIGMMGGGDVKFLMALGAWGGMRFSAEVAIWGIMIGGLFAALLILIKGRAMDFIARMKNFFFSLVVKEMEFEAPKIDRSLQMPYGIPIAVAAWVVLSGKMHLW